MCSTPLVGNPHVLGSLLFAHKIVNNRIKENSGNTNAASNQLEWGERFSEDQSDSNNDNHALCSISDRLGDGTSLLERHGSKFIVAVEEKTRGKKIGYIKPKEGENNDNTR